MRWDRTSHHRADQRVTDTSAARDCCERGNNMSQCCANAKTILQRWAAVGIMMALCFGLTGCSLASVRLSQLEQESKRSHVYGETVDTFFAALDAGDIQAMKTLFSVNTQNADTDLEYQLTALTEFYPGPTQVNLRFDTGGTGSDRISYGMRRSELSDSFLVGSNGTYFWCFLKMVDEDDWDENEVGITAVEFYSAGDYLKYHEEGWPDSNEVGVSIYADYPADYPVRPINRFLYRYDETTPPLREEDVLALLEQTDRWSDFLERFGQPNAFDVFWHYALQREDGTVAYLNMCVEEDDNEIVGVDVVGEFEWLYELWNNPKYETS